MPENTFHIDCQVSWCDLDSNQHMGNSAYLAYAVQSRFMFFDEHSFTPENFKEEGLGLVALNETITYYQEIRFLEKFKLELLCGGLNETRSKILFVNRFIGENGKLLAELKSLILWFNPTLRKSTVPPKQALRALSILALTEDFLDL